MSDSSDVECYVSDEDSSDNDYEDTRNTKSLNKFSKTNVQQIKQTLKDFDDADIRQDRKNEANRKLLLKEPVLISSNFTSINDHPVIQPSSTMWNQKHQRYLIWNYAGSISLTEVHGTKSATIRFGNSLGDNLNEHFVCHDDFTFGALSITGACLATSNEFYHHAFTKFPHLSGNNKSFRKIMPTNEIICAVTMGDGWIAIATTSQLLRLYTSAGLELRILCLSGSVICLCGVYTRLSVTLQKNRSKDIITDIFDISYFSGYSVRYIVKDQTLPLPKDHTLAWFGFEINQLNPVVITSDGQVMILCKLGVGLCGWSWAHVLDWTKVRKTHEDTFYPILVKDEQISYVKLRGISKPDIYPVPVQSAMNFRCSLTVDSSLKKNDTSYNALLQSLITDSMRLQSHDFFEEEKSLGMRNEILSSSQSEDDYARVSAHFDKNVMAVFQSACSKHDDAVAINCIFMSRTERALKAAILLANHFGRPGVAEFAELILQQKFNVERNIAVMEADNYNQFDNNDIELNDGVQSHVEKQKLVQVNPDDSKANNNIINGCKNPFAFHALPKVKESMFEAVLAINNPSPVRYFF
jgi:hypothetical protein